MALAVSFMNAAKWFTMQVVIVLGVLFPVIEFGFPYALLIKC